MRMRPILLTELAQFTQTTRKGLDSGDRDYASAWLFLNQLHRSLGPNLLNCVVSDNGSPASTVAILEVGNICILLVGFPGRP
jgi:hypothetical protein